MKKALLIIVSVLCLCGVSYAQKADDFSPSWNIQLKGGVGITWGETDFTNLMTPSAAVGFGYQFTPVFGLRMDFSGWQGMGYLIGYDPYKFNYFQDAIDATFDICNMFGYKAKRVINPYVFGGVAVNYRYNNDEALALRPYFPPELDNLWDNSALSAGLRAGLGIDFRLCNWCSLVLEANQTFLTDKFNSKVGSFFDHQIQYLAGLKFTLGKKKVAPAPAPVVEAPAPAPKPVVKEEPKEEPKPVVKEEPKEDVYVVENVLFIIDKWDIRPSEALKIDHIAQVLNDYPKAKVTITGYADKDTGTSSRNMFLSQKRAEIVTKYLLDKGIDASRIITEYKGSEVNPFKTPEENRVAVCIAQ